MFVKGYAAPETKAAGARARLLIEQAEALGENPEDPLLLFWVLYGFWLANYVAFDGDACCDLATQVVSLAEGKTANGPLLVGHRAIGTSRLHVGEIAEARTYLDRSSALYAPAESRSLATRYSLEAVAGLSYRAMDLWLLGYPEAALSDVEKAQKDARKIGQATSLMIALCVTALTHMFCGNHAAAYTQTDELIKLAQAKSAVMWRALGVTNKGCISAFTGKASDAVQMITSGIAASQSTETTIWTPFYLSTLTNAQAQLGQFDDAWRCIGASPGCRRGDVAYGSIAPV